MINIHEIINDFANLAKTKTAKQTGILYGSQILVMVLGLMIAPIVTRTLGPEKYGVLTFVLAVVFFIALFFEFGFFSAGARLLALSKNKKKDQELIGTLILITSGISFSFFLALFIFSFFVDSIFHTSVSNVLKAISILAAIIPFQYMLRQVCQGVNEIKKMAIADVIPKIWYLVGLLIVVGFLKLNIFIALVLNLTGIIIVVGLIIISLKPRFDNLRENLSLIWKETKEYGFHVFLGRIGSKLTFDSDKILIAYFTGPLYVGFYSLGMKLIAPISNLPRAFCISLFKKTVDESRVPAKLMFIISCWLIFTCSVLILFGRHIVIFLFTDKYIYTANNLIIPLTVAVFFQGLLQPYSFFLAAKGKGKYLKHKSVISIIVNLTGNLTLIPIYGAVGAAYATLAAHVASFIAHKWFYNKTLNELRLKKGGSCYEK